MNNSGRVESNSTKHLIATGGIAKSANDSLEERAGGKVRPGARRVYVTRATTSKPSGAVCQPVSGPS
jgi:hypothetical protein